jgi:hypothetical protein
LGAQQQGSHGGAATEDAINGGLDERLEQGRPQWQLPETGASTDRGRWTTDPTTGMLSSMDRGDDDEDGRQRQQSLRPTNSRQTRAGAGTWALLRGTLSEFEAAPVREPSIWDGLAGAVSPRRPLLVPPAAAPTLVAPTMVAPTVVPASPGAERQRSARQARAALLARARAGAPKIQQRSLYT